MGSWIDPYCRFPCYALVFLSYCSQNIYNSNLLKVPLFIFLFMLYKLILFSHSFSNFFFQNTCQYTCFPCNQLNHFLKKICHYKMKSGIREARYSPSFGDGRHFRTQMIRKIIHLTDCLPSPAL